jgi:hypothetical protein
VAPLDRNPLYVAGFVLVLALAQGRALLQQYVSGYRPFGHAPSRVAFSWDMFATAITRCDVQWSPPLHIGDRTVARLRDAGRTLEWDPVYDSVDGYMSAAHYGCTFADEATTATVRCVTFEGRTVNDAFRCR